MIFPFLSVFGLAVETPVRELFPNGCFCVFSPQTTNPTVFIARHGGVSIHCQPMTEVTTVAVISALVQTNRTKVETAANCVVALCFHKPYRKNMMVDCANRVSRLHTFRIAHKPIKPNGLNHFVCRNRNRLEFQRNLLFCENSA